MSLVIILNKQSVRKTLRIMAKCRNFALEKVR